MPSSDFENGNHFVCLEHHMVGTHAGTISGTNNPVEFLQWFGLRGGQYFCIVILLSQSCALGFLHKYNVYIKMVEKKKTL